MAHFTRQISERATRIKVEAVIVGDFLRQWIARIIANKSANTASRYKQIVDLFIIHLLETSENFGLVV